MSMIRGLTRAGLGDVTDERLIEMAAAGGFGAVDIDAVGLAKRHGAEGANELLRRHGMMIGAIGLPVEWRGSDEEFRASLTGLAEAAATARSVGCDRCCTYILPSTDHKPAAFMAQATYRLRVCAQILGAYGIRLGLEFVGPHHLRTAWKHPFIWTMEETLDWIAAIGEPNVGMLLDSFHWHTTGATAADIERLKPEQIVYVHLNDAPDVPVEEVRDNVRLYPGEGVIDLAGFLGALSRIGYRGVVSQEVLLPEAPSDSAEKLIARSKAGFDKAFAEAGL